MSTTPRALRRAKAWTVGAVALATVTTGLTGVHLALDRSASAAATATGAPSPSATPPAPSPSGGPGVTGRRPAHHRPSSPAPSTSSGFTDPGTVAPGGGGGHSSTHGS